MTGPGEAAAPRRVLVALEAGESAPALLEAAANLAAGLHAELVGLFVEDSELLEAPFTVLLEGCVYGVLGFGIAG